MLQLGTNNVGVTHRGKKVVQFHVPFQCAQYLMPSLLNKTKNDLNEGCASSRIPDSTSNADPKRRKI